MTPHLWGLQQLDHICDCSQIVSLTGQENENEIKERLQKLIRQLEQPKTRKHHLVSTTICVSQNTAIPNSVRYYGVSMSTSGLNPGKIMVAASCLSSWDSYVAGAVMTYYPEKVKKPYFDGTINLPKQVRRQAFRLSNRQLMRPCRSCRNLFGLTTRDKKEWAYGNCAEAESLSNLLINEREVREQARPTSITCTDENRQRAEDSVLEELRGVLNEVEFNWDEEYYTPQTV